MQFIFSIRSMSDCHPLKMTIEPRHDKTNKMSVHPAKTRISLGISLIRAFAVRSMGS